MEHKFRTWLKEIFSSHISKCIDKVDEDAGLKSYDIWKDGKTNEAVIITKTFHDENGKFKFEWEIPNIKEEI